MSGNPVSKTSASPSTSPTCGGVLLKGPRGGGGKRSAVTVSREAQRVAAAVLEVLAGVRTPREAAEVLDVSLPRYYLWEQRALEGLVRACEPRPVGKAASEKHRIAALEKEVARWRQDCTRQQALVRASQRTIALGPSPQAAAKGAARPAARLAEKSAHSANGKAGRKRRAVVRALTAAVALQAAASQVESGEIAPGSSSAGTAEVVQRSDTNSSWAGAPGASTPAVLPQA